jgi:hypothetical protein
VSRADELRAELELLDAEERFAQAKETGVTMKEKLELRKLRKAFREQRAGSASTAPEPIQTSTSVTEIGA